MAMVMEKKLGIFLSVRKKNSIPRGRRITTQRKKERKKEQPKKRRRNIDTKLELSLYIVFSKHYQNMKEMKFLFQFPCCSCFCFIKPKKSQHKEKEAKTDWKM